MVVPVSDGEGRGFRWERRCRRRVVAAVVVVVVVLMAWDRPV